MIVARVPEGIRVVMQTDHQSQCGLIAARWGNPQMARPEPWEPIQLAADWHDEGWRQWERAPDVQPDGQPRGFIAMDPEAHMAIHRRSIGAATDRDLVAGMLVGMHCAGLVQQRMGLDGDMPDVATLPDPVRQLVRDELAVRERVTQQMGDPDEVESWTWAAYRVLQALDRLSLYLTWNALARGDAWTLHRVPRHRSDDHGVAIAVTPVDAVTCALDPWPFADRSMDAPVLARIIPDRPYADGADLHTALLAADPAPVAFRLVPAVRA